MYSPVYKAIGNSGEKYILSEKRHCGHQVFHKTAASSF